MTYEDEWVTYLRNERRYSDLTVRNYLHDLRNFVDFTLHRGDSSAENDVSASEEFDPTIVRADDVREWIAFLSETGNHRCKDGKPIGAASINRAVYSLHSYFRFLRLRNLVSVDFTGGIGALRTQRRLPSFIGDSKMDDVMQHILSMPRDGEYKQRRDRMIILLFYALGIRLAELVGMNTDDFEQDSNVVKVMGKGDKQRNIPLVDYVKKEILYFMNLNSVENICKTGEKALFLSGKGRRITRIEVYRVVQRELGKFGVEGKRSPHVLRHTFATRLMDEGADMRQIQELLGHNSLNATQIYTHNSISALKEVYRNAHPRGRGEEKAGDMKK